MTSHPFERVVIVYAWLCPRTGAVVYVGKTSADIATRMRSHLRCARRGYRTQKYDWLRSELAEGRTPLTRELERCDVQSSSLIERKWIEAFRENGKLLNDAAGGCGNPGVGRVEWSPAILAQLGARSDEDIAAELGCNRATVTYRRRVLGIPAYPVRKPPPNTVTLPAEIVAQLGTKPDYLLAREAGVSKFVIAKHRRRLGIQDYAATTGNTGRIVSGEPHRRWIGYEVLPAEAMSILGKVPDKKVADIFGLKKINVTQYRLRNGIAASRKWIRKTDANGSPIPRKNARAI